LGFWITWNIAQSKQSTAMNSGILKAAKKLWRLSGKRKDSLQPGAVQKMESKKHWQTKGRYNHKQ